MFKHFGFDWNIVEAIETQLQQGSPSAKTLRHFYRQGLRHGRRGVALTHMRDFIVNVVELSSDRITTRQFEEIHRVQRELESLRTKKELGEAALASIMNETETDLSISAETPTTESDLGTEGPDLVAALDRLVLSRHMRQRADENARRASDADKIRAELDELVVAISVAEKLLKQLPDELRQHVASCQEAGEVMWTRYRLGYLRGSTRRGSGEAPTDSPMVDIEFQNPVLMEVSK